MAWLYMYFDVLVKQRAVLTNTPQLHFVKDNQIGKPILDAAIGISWESSFGQNEQFYFLGQVGWENHIFFGQEQFIRFISNGLNSTGRAVSNLGDLTIQGFTFSMKFGF